MQLLVCMQQSRHKRSLALVGAGYWGKNLARNFFELNVLHTICDVHETVLDEFASIYPQLSFTSNYHSVLDSRQIEQVVIASPSNMHYTLAKQALLAGKHVYVEKPLCLHTSEAEELLVLAQKQSLTLMVGHILQYHPYMQHLQEMIKGGELGKLHYISCNRLNFGAIRKDENVLWDLAPHDISSILSLCQNKLPRFVRCVGGSHVIEGFADHVMMTMHFDGELYAQINLSRLHPFKEQKLVVVGSAGMVVFDDTKPWAEKLLIYWNRASVSPSGIPQLIRNEPEVVEVLQKEPLREECIHFLTCCREKVTPRTDAREALRVLKVLEAAEASLQEMGETKTLQEHFVEILE